MSDIWLSSDFHFGHDKEFIYSYRGFNNIEEHDEALFDNLSIIKPNDTLYFLGDLYMNNGFNNAIELKKFLFKKIMIAGNHDTLNKVMKIKNEGIFEYITYGDLFPDGKNRFYLSHYPLMIDNNKNYKIFNIHGHTHFIDKIEEDITNINVSLDAWNMHPANLEEIRSLICQHVQ